MHWCSDDRSIQLNVSRQKSGLNKAFFGHRSSSVFLTNILKYRLGHQLQNTLQILAVIPAEFAKSEDCDFSCTKLTL